MGESPYADLARPPWREADLIRALVVPGGLWTEVRLHQETASTNTDAVAAAVAGTPEGLVVVAERQTAGRGRMGRGWQSPPRAGIAVSVLLRPGSTVPTNRWGWLPLLAGVAVVDSVARVARCDADLKWPNDVLLAGRKCGGILAEVVPRSTVDSSAIVIGIGVNVTVREHELAHPFATSLSLMNGFEDREILLREILRTLARWYTGWRVVAGDPERSGLAGRYRETCATIGQSVRISLPDGTVFEGQATGVDQEGRLMVDGADGVTVVAAGDVVHVRPTG